MPVIGMYLVFAAVALRAVVVLSMKSEFSVVMVLLAGYGVLLVVKTWQHPRTSPPIIRPAAQFTYLFVQSVLVISVMVISSYEDFLAMLFIPLSLDAVSTSGRRVGFLVITVFSLALTLTLLFSDVGWIFGLVMGLLYAGICWLVGGYAYQIQMARTIHDQHEHMLQELQSTHRQLQSYVDQVANLAIEKEHNRLAHELHDSVTQTVFSMNLAVQSVHMLLNKEPAGAARQLIRVEELAASAQHEIQTLVSQLRPDLAVGADLPDALRQLAAQLQVRNSLQVSLEIPGSTTASSAVAAGLYSIVHEALINVAKHSGACEAIVRLNLTGGSGCLEIEDRGAGFDPDAVMERSGHLGLVGMREHAHKIGWDLSLWSQPGQGTRIVATGTLLGELG